MSADPTTTPSATAATGRAVSAFETPKPTATGRLLTAFVRLTKSGTSWDRALRAPVTPVTETA